MIQTLIHQIVFQVQSRLILMLNNPNYFKIKYLLVLNLCALHYVNGHITKQEIYAS